LRPRIAVAYSVKDPAGSGAASRLLELASNTREGSCPLASKCWILEGDILMGGYDSDTVDMEFLDETPDPQAEAVIVLSRHSSTAGRPSLTTHHVGNPTKRTLGGDPETLGVSAPPLSRALLRAYREEAETLGLTGEYEVTLEATHHGPTGVSKPIVFIEIGSTPDRWADPKAQEAMALAVLRVLRSPLERCEAAAGFGETHYPRKFTEIHLDGDYCMGHIIPRYALQEGVPPRVVEQAINKTWPSRPRVALIHKKSLRSEQRKGLIDHLKSLGVETQLI